MIALNRTGVVVGSVVAIAATIWLTSARSATATVRWTEVHQIIDGFGGAAADFVTPLTPAQADFFFTIGGIGLTILRTQIIPDRATCDANFHQGGCSDSNGQVLNGELETAKLAVARGAIVFSTPWSPPGAYKTNGSFTNGGSLLRAHYSDWAGEIATYVKTMASAGVPLYAVSVQNEPNWKASYGSCFYSAQEIHDFIPYLHSALQSVGAGSTRIMIAEQSYWSVDLAGKAMADPAVAPEIGIIAAHGYTGEIRPYSSGGAPLWQTEDSSQSPVYDGSMADALKWAVKISDYLSVANVNAWVWWFLTDMPGQGEGTDNAALTDIHGDYPKRAYVTGQWSRFVRPGWLRIGVAHSGPVRITAFKDPQSQSFAIVAVNPRGWAVSQTFSLNGFSAHGVTPWITSSKLSLEAQTPVPVTHSAFTYSLPQGSVTTFSGRSAR